MAINEHADQETICSYTAMRDRVQARMLDWIETYAAEHDGADLLGEIIELTKSIAHVAADGSAELALTDMVKFGYLTFQLERMTGQRLQEVESCEP